MTGVSYIPSSTGKHCPPFWYEVPEYLAAEASPEIDKTAKATRNVVCAMIGAKQLGIICLMII